jgi:hypothetical protein
MIKHASALLIGWNSPKPFNRPISQPTLEMGRKILRCERGAMQNDGCAGVPA